MDELELFNRALTQVEVRAIWAAGNLGKCKPNPDGTPGVLLKVIDGPPALSDTATIAQAAQALTARAFTVDGNSIIRLASAEPLWCAVIEPVGASYSNRDVDLSSLKLFSQGTGVVSEISSAAGKASVAGDHDGNGAQEILACFSKTDLRSLFSGVSGKRSLTVTMEGDLVTGGVIRGVFAVEVIGSGGALTSSVSPNPFNPLASLTFVTTVPGFARVRLFDITGRLVRTLMDEAHVAAGYHDLTIDGRDGSGRQLPSGIYFYRIEAVGATSVGRVAIMK